MTNENHLKNLYEIKNKNNLDSQPMIKELQKNIEEVTLRHEKLFKEIETNNNISKKAGEKKDKIIQELEKNLTDLDNICSASSGNLEKQIYQLKTDLCYKEKEIKNVTKKIIELNEKSIDLKNSNMQIEKELY